MKLTYVITFFCITFGVSTSFAKTCSEIYDDEYYEQLKTFYSSPEAAKHELSSGDICFNEDCSLAGLKKRVRYSKFRKFKAYKDISYVEISLSLYGFNMYRPLNSMLRNDELARPPIVEDLAFVLSCALDTLPAYKGTVYRAIRSMSVNLIRKHIPGKVVLYRGFTSTSEEQYVFLGTKPQFEILSKNGKSISDYVMLSKEKEVLFDRNSCFFVESNNFDRDNLKIRLIEKTCPDKDTNEFSDLIYL